MLGFLIFNCSAFAMVGSENNSETPRGTVTIKKNHEEDLTSPSFVRAMREAIKKKEYKSFLDERNISEEEKGILGEKAGDIYSELGFHNEAILTFEESLGILNKNIKLHHKRIAKIYVNLGNIYRKTSRFKEAIEKVEKGLAIYKEYALENQAESIWALAQLGHIHKGVGDYKKAAQILKEANDLYEKHYPDRYSDISWVKARLANVYWESGAYKEASSILEETLSVYRNHIPQDHEGIIWALTHLAGVYMDFGFAQKAKDLLEEGLDMSRTKLDKDRPDSGGIIGFLGNAYRMLGNFEKAEAYLKQSIDYYTKISLESSTEHVFLGWSKGLLGCVYRDMSDFEKAEELLQFNLTLYQKIYGDNHPETGRTVVDLGQVYLKKDKLDVAENYFLRALQIFQPAGYPETYLCFESLADLYQKKFNDLKNRGISQEAEKLKLKVSDYLEKSITVLKEKFPDNSPHSARVQLKLKKLKEN